MDSALHERHERLWIPIVAPAIWAAHFTLCQITVALWCGRLGTTAPLASLHSILIALTVFAIGGIALSFLHGFRRRSPHLPAGAHDDDTPEDRRHFLAFTTMLLAGLSLLATIFVAAGALLAGGCW